MESETTRVKAVRSMLSVDSPPALNAALREQSKCPDCGAAVADPHLSDCDIARCLLTGYPRLLCEEDHDHGQHDWSGIFPGTIDAIELGLWARLESGLGWVPATPHDEGAMPDLNALIERCHWDPYSQRWVRTV
jgi:hypothetical protein